MTNAANTFGYEVSLLTTIVGNTREDRKNETQTFTFNNEDALEARREAIKKSMEVVNEYQSNPEYVGYVEAAARGFINYSSYSLSLEFIDGDERYEIMGGAENDEIVENLSTEARILMDNGYQFDIREVELSVEQHDSTVDVYNEEVIAEDLDFLLV